MFFSFPAKENVLDTRFLESLLAVAETGSIANAARQQGLTAAAVSQRIRVLETGFGTALLNRTAHAAVPTEACLRLLPAARDLIRDAHRLARAVDGTGLSGPFRLGAASTALLDFAPAIIQRFRTAAPGAVLTIRPGASQSLYDDLLADRIDAAITVSPGFRLPKDVRRDVLVVQPLMHATPAGLEPRQVSALPWIVYDRQSWGGRQIWEEYGRAISSGHILCELDALEMIAMMVAQGSGQAIVPQWQGLQSLVPQICLQDLDTERHREMVFLRKHSKGAAGLAQLVFEAVQSEVESAT